MKAKLFQFLFSLRETVANWRVPCTKVQCGDIFGRVNNKVNNPSSQRRLVLVIVCIALLLDNMLYMVIVPIIPSYLRKIDAFGYGEMFNKSALTVQSFTLMSSAADPPQPLQKVVTTNLTQQNSLSKNDSSSPIRSPVYDYDTNEDINVGLLFATKAIFQLLVNPFTGTLMDRIGYDIPMMIGLSIIFTSTTVFAFGTSYGVLFVARSLQGLGSAFADTSGLAMIADRFTEPASRTRALGLALAFISFGSLVAPPFGGTLYDFIGKEAPFIVLAFVALLDGVLMLFVMKPVRIERSMLKEKQELPKGTPIYRLILDPYIAICAGSLVMANVSLAFLEPTIALWMKDTMHAPEWQMGLIWLPAFPPHVLGVIVTVKLAEKYPSKQWLMAAIGIALEGVSCIIVPFCKSFEQLMIPLSVLCFGIALVDTAILPMMGHLVDVKYSSVYGSIYAIADISYSMAYAFGPIVAGQLVHAIGFTWLNVAIFISNILYAPLLIFNRHIYKYQTFKNDDASTDGVLNHKLCKAYSSLDEEPKLLLNERQPSVIITDNVSPDGESDQENDDDSSDGSADTQSIHNEPQYEHCEGQATKQYERAKASEK